MNSDARADLDVTEAAIRERAYEVSQRPDAGTPEENWGRALRELQDEWDREHTAAAAGPDTVDVSPFPPFTSATTHP